MKTISKALWTAMAVSLLISSCKKDEQNVAPTDDNEAITTAILSLTNTANTQEVVTATLDNLTATLPDVSKATLSLKANATYSGTVQLYDKTQTPTVDATAEIREKANEHLFIYTPSATSLLTVTITDRDSNPAPGPYPIGLAYTLKAGAAAAGTLNVRLRHQPNAKNGTATPGTDDLNVNFPVVIQ